MAAARFRRYGWGGEGEGLTAAEEAFILDRYRQRFGVDGFEEKAPPPLADITLAQPRLVPPASLSRLCTSERHDRAQHTYGKSYQDYVRGLAGDYANAPDLVAYPESEADIAQILDWAGGAGAAVTPLRRGARPLRRGQAPRHPRHLP